MPLIDVTAADQLQSDGPVDGPEWGPLIALIVKCAHGCHAPEAFRDMVRSHVKPVLPHQFSVAVLGCLSFDHLTIRHMVGIDYSEAHLAAIPRQTRLQERPVVARWLTTREPTVIDPIRDVDLLSPLELREVSAFGLGRFAIHGQIDLSSSMASYFSLAGLPDTLSDTRAKLVLRMITPHLHAALMSLPAMSMSSTTLERLTPLERELLIWLAAGRSNAEIANLRGRRLTTVRNQLTTLFRKLQVSTRAEAVAVASTEGFSLGR